MVLLFWAIWFSIVALSNLADALKHLGVLPAGFTFASGNFAFMQQVIAVHHTPSLLAVVMFAGVILWEIAAAALFFQAFAKSRIASVDEGAAVTRAFTVSVAFWAAMMIASEIFISYNVEATHTRLLIASLVSFIVTTPYFQQSASKGPS
jgi:hypothetical protein